MEYELTYGILILLKMYIYFILRKNIDKYIL